MTAPARPRYVGRLLLPGLLLLCLVAACDAATPPGEPGGEPTETSAPASPPHSPDSPRPPTSPPPPPGTHPPGAEVTVRGVVQDGVEPGCLILATGTEQYLLLGAGGAMAKPGAEVVVTGRVEPDTLTTCQQGVPLAVTDVRPT